jgi:hypothetical protein
MRIKPLFGATLLALTLPAAAQTFSLSLQIDDGSRWYDYFSDAFGEVGKQFNGSASLNGFYQISALPAYTQIGGGFAVFPSGGAFANVGSIGYDASSYGGSGLGTAPITSITADFAPFAGFDATVFGEGVNYSTAFANAVGTVSLFNGAVTGVDLEADVTFTYDITGFGNFPFAGKMTIDDDEFMLAAGSGSVGEFAFQWDLKGSVQNLSPVPEASTNAMLLAGLAGVSLILRRRAREGARA